MIFNSVEFLLFFLPAFFLIYRLASDRYKNPILLTASLIFYAMGEPGALVFLMVSVLVNYVFALHLSPGVRQKGTEKKQKKTKYEKRRKRIFLLAMILNLAPLICCKLLWKELPLGISFYSFQILSYLIDVYRGDIQKEREFVRYATYLVMFPQLVSGPIVRYGEVKDALVNREFTVENLTYGMKVFILGLTAKVLLADRLSLLWRQVQITGFESISTPLAWIAAVAYSLKIYFDFYGYSLMAIGLGHMLGIPFPDNFRHPYMAVSVRDFYRRWHMTLGRWFCSYVYIPLGGSRRGEFRTICNLLLVWTLTAVWHGTTVNFLIWGLGLGILIILERLWERLGLTKLFSHGFAKLIPHLYLLAVIPVTWICFAVTDLPQLQIYLGRMFGMVQGIRVSTGDWLKALQNYWYLILIGAVASTPLVEKAFRRWKDHVICSVLLVLLFWVCVWRLQVEGQNPFMYFKF